MIYPTKRTWIKRSVRPLPPLQAVGRVNNLAFRVQRDPGALPLPLQRRIRLLRQFAQAHVFRVLLEYVRVGIGDGGTGGRRAGSRILPLVVVISHVGYGYIVAGVSSPLMMILHAALQHVLSPRKHATKLAQNAAQRADLGRLTLANDGRRLLARGRGQHLDRRVQVLVLAVDHLHLRGADRCRHQHRSARLKIALPPLRLFTRLLRVPRVLLLVVRAGRGDHAHGRYTARVDRGLRTDPLDPLAPLEIARLGVLEFRARPSRAGRARGRFHGR